MPCTCSTRSTKAPDIERAVWRLLIDTAGKLHCTVGFPGLTALPINGAYGIYTPGNPMNIIFDGQYDHAVTAIARQIDGKVWLGTSPSGLIMRYDEVLEQMTGPFPTGGFPMEGCLCAAYIYNSKLYITKCLQAATDPFVSAPCLITLELPKGRAKWIQFAPYTGFIDAKSVPNSIIECNDILYISTRHKPNVYYYNTNNPPVEYVPRLFYAERANSAQSGIYCLTLHTDGYIYGVVSSVEGDDHQPWLFKFLPGQNIPIFIGLLSTFESESLCCKSVPGKGIYIGTSTKVGQVDETTNLWRADLYLYDGTLASLDAPIISGVCAEEYLSALEFDGDETLYIGTAPRGLVLALNINSGHIQTIYEFGINP